MAGQLSELMSTVGKIEKKTQQRVVRLEGPGGGT